MSTSDLGCFGFLLNCAHDFQWLSRGADVSVVHVAREAALDALAVLVPVDCAGCGAADRSVCAQCRAAVARATPLRRTLPGGLVVRSAAPYEGALRALLLALKENGRTDAAAPLRALVHPLLTAASIARTDCAPPELVCVPPSRQSASERGYDPVRVLVRGHEVSRALRSTGQHDTAQKRLDALERANNRRGAFEARGSLAGRRFVVVDDILTTGATLLAAAEAIRAAGGDVVGAVTLAATPRRHPVRNGARVVAAQ